MWPMHQWSLKLLCPMVKEEMHLQENTLYDLDLVIKVTQNVVQYPPNYITYAPAKFEVATSSSFVFTRNYIKWPWCQGHTKCCPVPAASCDLCTCEVWSWYVQWFGRRCIYKKIHYLTLGSRSHRSHEVLHSTLNIMWPMHMKNLKLLLQKVYVEMRLQENTLFDLGVKVTQNVDQYPLHYVIYASTKFEVATSNGLGEDTITRNMTDARTNGRWTDFGT